MGVEFIEKTAKSFKKRWDRGRGDLATSDLLTRAPTKAERTFTADIKPGIALKKGDKLTVESSGGRLVASLGFTECARADAPPTALVQAVEARQGIAQGTVSEIYELAGVADISLC